MQLRPLPLTLGTASFGMPYGIANPPDGLPAESVETMLDLAWDNGITSFDTAPGYGEAEVRLGRWIKRRGISPHITTKLPALAQMPDTDVADAIDAALESSVKRLGVRPQTYLAHSAADYLRAPARDMLHELAARGKVQRVGLSAYTDAEVFAALAARPPDVIQLPISVFDHRIVSSGALAACAAADVAVFARSVFLQGVLLMEPNRLPVGLEDMSSPLKAFQAYTAHLGTTRASVAIRYVRDLPGITSTVVGAYSPDQIRDLIEAAREPELAPERIAAVSAIANRAPKELLDPRTWRKKNPTSGQRV